VIILFAFLELRNCFLFVHFRIIFEHAFSAKISKWYRETKIKEGSVKAGECTKTNYLFSAIDVDFFLKKIQRVVGNKTELKNEHKIQSKEKKLHVNYKIRRESLMWRNR
jgi:hypothetical protein